MIGLACAFRAAHLAADRLGMRLDVQCVEGWPLALARTNATATLPDAAGGFRGHGGGADHDEAAMRAVMECAERFAQFGCAPSGVEVASWNSVRDRAIRPDSFGLYARAQYAWGGFPCRPFAPDVAIEWVTAIDVLEQRARLVPIEFVHPKAELSRAPLVCETSSGCAAHTEPEDALVASVCEIIERDSLMLFWYRQPETATLPIDDIPFADVREDLTALRSLGYVITAAMIDYDLDIPCVLVFALQGDDLSYGLGCHPEPHRALTRAVVELGTALARLQFEPAGQRVYRSIANVKTPDDHYRLYHRGPRHGFFRQVLAGALRGGDVVAAKRLFDRPAAPDAATAVLGALARRGCRAYSCDITPPSMRESGIVILRTLVPGLIPLHFGFERMRLGCERLVGTDSPGRLRHLLPHFMN